MREAVTTLAESKKAQRHAVFVKKREGNLVDFDPSKIANAITKAFESTGEADSTKAWELTAVVVSRLEGEIVEIETIQDIVEDTLMNAGYRKTAKAYILYRAKRAENRNTQKLLSQTLQVIDDYVNIRDWRINENSNMTFSLQGLNAHISSTITANYWLSKLYTPEIGEAHRSGAIHIHDLGALSAYCVGWDLEQLLIGGFGGVSGKVESRPARHFRTALGQIVNFFYTLQGEAAGAQAFANFDTLLAPFVYYDGLSYAEVKQAMQEFVFNLNVPTRVGFQTPFTNITFDLRVPSYFANQYVIVGGEIKDKTYGEFQEEIYMINQAFAEVMIEGDGKGRPFTFPIPTYNITKDFAWDNPRYKAIWEMTAKYGTPYFSNFVNSDMSEEDARSMCCRLRLDNREVRNQLSKKAIIHHEEEHHLRRGGLFAANPLTGSIGVVTINLPRIAYLSKSEEEFFSRLLEVMQIAKTSLEIKRKVVEDLTERNLYPYTKIYLSDIKKRSGNYWTNHFSTIGILGMNEAVINLKKIPYHTDEGRDFAVRVLDFMLEHLEQFKQETGHLYNLEASPAEGASYRLAKADKTRFPDIITSGTNEAPYYTNSVHLPVNYTDDIFEVLDHQDPLQSRFTGGTVIHIFLGEKITDPFMVAKLVEKIAHNYHLPYYSITPTFSICPVHGYIPGEHWICPYPHTEADLKRYGKYLECL
ncbi:Ribonucleotide reductase of class III (anaerobic), large subunit [Brevinematales bacterium NS]|nr:ribonucleoside triphosphate reductase [Brevinematales bacterium]QJR21018.1 Ribonucleotide reductase of class III (anaerobic), large subunit [Brevinematales bacterium NS]